MSVALDIVGHFGTRYSYATIGSRLARALRDRGLLGSVFNLDPKWHADHADLHVPGRAQGSHVFVLSAPHHYLDAYPALYQRERSAIFVCPNTDTLAQEHVETCRQFGLLVVPSVWCAAVVADAGLGVATLLPLGADELLAATSAARRSRLLDRCCAERIPVAVHFSTDQWWPGRKGTEELLEAWATLNRGRTVSEARMQLVVHVPPALQLAAMYRIRDLKIDQSVELLVSDEGGSGDQLIELFDRADLIVAPSRCEGFGIMFLSSLVAGVPLLATCHTGHRMFLPSFGGWLGLPEGEPAPLAGEEGLAPTVDQRPLASALDVLLRATGARERLLATGPGGASHDTWSWTSVMDRWVAALTGWMRETTG